MSITCAEVGKAARGETARVDVDWGENTSGSETGALKAGDTVASCTIAVDDKPASASDPTLGSVTANTGDLYINGRLCSAGEATTCQITFSSSAVYGTYRFKLTATTTNGYTPPRFIKITVSPPG